MSAILGGGGALGEADSKQLGKAGAGLEVQFGGRLGRSCRGESSEGKGGQQWGHYVLLS